MGRKIASGTGNYNDHFVMQHDLLQELAIHQSSQEPVAQRKRLIINITGNGLPTWWTVQNEFHIAARILSVSTGLFLSPPHSLDALICYESYFSHP